MAKTPKVAIIELLKLGNVELTFSCLTFERASNALIVIVVTPAGGNTKESI